MDGSFFKLTKNGDRMVIIKKEKFTSEKSVLYVKKKKLYLRVLIQMF